LSPAPRAVTALHRRSPVRIRLFKSQCSWKNCPPPRFLRAQTFARACRAESLPRFCHWPAGSAAAARGAVFAGSAADAALVIFALWILSLNCRGRAFSALISSLKYLNLHFHNQTAGLSMMYMNTSKNKANRLNYELFICLSHSQTSQAPQSFHMVTLRPQFDGSKLNTDSIENFHII
jgi:hypothetical protein